MITYPQPKAAAGVSKDTRMSLNGLPSPETMLAYASALEKQQYVVKNGVKYPIPTGEIVEAACAALRYCANALPSSDQCVAREALERQRCIAICEGWIGDYQDREIKFTSPREYALDAINDIIDLIRDGHVPALTNPAPQHRIAVHNEGAPQPEHSAVNQCPSCKRMFRDGEVCARGGCPMGGDF